MNSAEHRVCFLAAEAGGVCRQDSSAASQLVPNHGHHLQRQCPSGQPMPGFHGHPHGKEVIPRVVLHFCSGCLHITVCDWVSSCPPHHM